MFLQQERSYLYIKNIIQRLQDAKKQMENKKFYKGIIRILNKIICWREYDEVKKSFSVEIKRIEDLPNTDLVFFLIIIISLMRELEVIKKKLIKLKIIVIVLIQSIINYKQT